MEAPLMSGGLTCAVTCATPTPSATAMTPIAKSSLFRLSSVLSTASGLLTSASATSGSSLQICIG